jgi:hypothetical protein
MFENFKISKIKNMKNFYLVVKINTNKMGVLFDIND